MSFIACPFETLDFIVYLPFTLVGVLQFRPKALFE